jgi:hypothetical protein
MTLEQLMAFTVTDDQARQEQVWEGLASSYNKEPYYNDRLSQTEGRWKWRQIGSKKGAVARGKCPQIAMHVD